VFYGGVLEMCRMHGSGKNRAVQNWGASADEGGFEMEIESRVVTGH